MFFLCYLTLSDAACWLTLSSSPRPSDIPDGNNAEPECNKQSRKVAFGVYLTINTYARTIVFKQSLFQIAPPGNMRIVHTVLRFTYLYIYCGERTR